MVDPIAEAKILRSFAEHFTLRDWNYTRLKGDLHSIRYDSPEDRFGARLRSALGWLLKPTPAFAKGWSPNRFYMFAHALKRDRHLPDGVLDGGSIITFWEETGEYLQLVQPSVGSLIADFLESDPEHPNAIKIAEELHRVSESYGKRVDAGLVDGRRAAQ